MPNHIENRLTIIGAPETVAAFAERARAVPPRPGRSRNALIAQIEDAERAQEGEPQPSALSFHAIVPLPAAYTTEPYDPYGFSVERSTWGVKWGAYSIGPVERSDDGSRATYTFTTAWSAPQLWLARASSAWPSLTFALSYGGEGPARGRLAYRAGRALLEQHDPYRAEDYPPSLADDADAAAEDAWCEACRAAERLHITSHDTWIASGVA